MIIPAPIPYRKSNRLAKRRRTSSAPTPPTALELVSAAIAFVEGQRCVRLTFNQAIDASAFDSPSLSVDDGADSHDSYVANGVEGQPVPQTIFVRLEANEHTESTTTTLSVFEPTGIVAVNGGAAWGGVMNLALPFGA